MMKPEDRIKRSCFNVTHVPVASYVAMDIVMDVLEGSVLGQCFLRVPSTGTECRKLRDIIFGEESIHGFREGVEILPYPLILVNEGCVCRGIVDSPVDPIVAGSICGIPAGSFGCTPRQGLTES
jgi:hypothetical protein